MKRFLSAILALTMLFALIGCTQEETPPETTQPGAAQFQQMYEEAAEKLTSDLIWARAYKPNEQGDSNGWRMHFSILCGDVVVTVRSKGVDPDWLWARLSALCADPKPQ